MPDYKIEFSKPDKYSPTILESMKVVKRTMLDVMMVTDKCPIHGGGETVARFYEIEKQGWEYLDNSELRARIVDPMLADLRRSKVTDKSTEEEMLFQMMWYTGLRLDQVGNMKVSDIDLNRDFGAVKY